LVLAESSLAIVKAMKSTFLCSILVVEQSDNLRITLNKHNDLLKNHCSDGSSNLGAQENLEVNVITAIFMALLAINIHAFERYYFV